MASPEFFATLTYAQFNAPMNPAEASETAEESPGGRSAHRAAGMVRAGKDVPMQVALAADERFFAGMACAIFSVVSASDREKGIDFHIMDGGIDGASWDFLERKLSALGPGIRLRRHPISKAAFEGFPTDERGGVMTYARLLMESLIEAEEVIYLDCDILCFRNLRKLWEDPMGDNLIAACQDWGVKTLAEDTVYELSAEDARRMYFNAGFMKVNLRQWREEGVQLKSVEFLREYGAISRWWDQTALNLVCKGRVLYLEGGYNFYYIHEVILEDFTHGRINIHYATRKKPWLTYDGKIISNVVWRIYFQRCMGAWGRGREWPDRTTERRYMTALYLVVGSGAVLILAITAVRVCLGWLAWNESVRAARDWLNRRRIGVQIVRWAWKRASMLKSG